MRWIVLLVIALLIGFGLFSLIDIYPDNYVKVYVDNWLVEMSFAGFLLVLFLLTCAMYLTLWAVGLLFRSTTFFSRWRKKRKVQKAGDALGSGYLMLIKGDWRRAEKKLIARTDNSAVPYVNFLAAAQAAQEQGQYSRRDEYLVQAYKAAPDQSLAIGLAKARLHHLAGQHDMAMSTLDDIAGQGRKNAQFMAMRLQNYQATNQWDKVHDLLPQARKLDALPPEVLDQIDTQAHRSLLLISSDKDRVWKELPKAQKQDAENILAYAQSLLAANDNSGAEKLVRSALKNHYDDRLVNFYGKLSSDKPIKLRRAVEGWLMARPESAELSLAAGRLAMQEPNVELAKTYLERSIELGKLPGAYASLGALLESEDENSQALKLYRAGLAKLTQKENVLLSAEAKSESSSMPAEGAQKELAVREGELV